MILGTNIDWDTFLRNVKKVDVSLIRDNNSKDISSFVKIFNKLFPNKDAYNHIFCSEWFETPSEDVALQLVTLFPQSAYSDCIVFLTGDLYVWSNALKVILNERFYKSVNRTRSLCVNRFFKETFRSLYNIDKSLYKDVTIIHDEPYTYLRGLEDETIKQ